MYCPAVGPGDRSSDRSRLDHYRHPLKPGHGPWHCPCPSGRQGCGGPVPYYQLPFREREDYDAIVKLAGSGCYVLADLVLTQYEGSMYIPLAVIRGGNIFAYAPKQKKTSAQIRQYLTLSVKAAGSTAVPSVDTDFQAFSQRIKKIPALKEGPSKTDEAIRRDVLSRAV